MFDSHEHSWSLFLGIYMGNGKWENIPMNPNILRYLLYDVGDVHHSEHKFIHLLNRDEF